MIILSSVQYVEKSQKSVFTSFWVQAAPETWLKYTTPLKCIRVRSMTQKGHGALPEYLETAPCMFGWLVDLLLEEELDKHWCIAIRQSCFPQNIDAFSADQNSIKMDLSFHIKRHFEIIYTLLKEWSLNLLANICYRPVTCDKFDKTE